MSVRDTIRSIPGASPPHLGGRTGRDECDTCIGKGRNKSDQIDQTKSDFTPGFRFKVCLHHPSRTGKDASGRENGTGCFFSLLQMGANNPSLTPLNCILKNWDRFDPQGLKKTLLVFL